MTHAKKLTSKSWNTKTMNIAMSPVKTSHTRSPELQNRQSYRRPGETRATPRVSSLVTHPLYRSLRGKQLENQTHRHGHTRYLRKALYFGEPLGAPLLAKNRVCNSIHPKQVGPFPKRLILPYLDKEILSGYEEDVSSKRDGFSAWVKTDFVNTLGRHTVDVKGVNAAFRDAPARKHSASGQEYHFNNDMPNRLTEQKRLSVYNWNPGPQRGKEGAIEKHIAVKWHIITLQEAIEYLDQEFLSNRFHVTQYGGCAILLNKDTFFSDIKVTSLYLHDLRYSQQDKVKEGDTGWVLQVVISRASFHRTTIMPRSAALVRSYDLLFAL